MKKIITISLAALIALLCFIFNPDEEKHRAKVTSVITAGLTAKEMKSEEESPLVSFMAENVLSYLTKAAVNTNVYADNYLLFSLTKYEEKVIGLGILNNVFLFFSKEEVKQKILEFTEEHLDQTPQFQ